MQKKFTLKILQIINISVLYEWVYKYYAMTKLLKNQRYFIIFSKNSWVACWHKQAVWQIPGGWALFLALIDYADVGCDTSLVAHAPLSLFCGYWQIDWTEFSVEFVQCWFVKISYAFLEFNFFRKSYWKLADP